MTDSTNSTGFLRIDSLSIAFGGVRAVDGVSFSARQGSVVGIVGPNGAGKTTLLNGVSGVLPLAGGEVWLADTRLDRLRAHRIAAHGIARTFQAVEVFNDFTVLDYLLLGRLRFHVTSLLATALQLPKTRRSERAERERAMSTLAQFDLEAAAGVPLRELGYGQRKLVDLLRARLSEPRVLLLDEPTSGTSAQDREQLRSTLLSSREQGVTTVVVDHDVRFVSDTCDKIVVITSGQKIAEGEPGEVLQRPDVVQAYIGG
jgi:branched-chain amino acid transport system ATP-binding protein